MVIAYLRVGTSNKELLEEQKDEIERYASNHDMNVDKWITDVTVDKGREDERNLARGLDRMQKGDSLIFSDISRLGRTLSEVMDIMGRCMEKGVQIYSIRDRYILDQALDLPVMGNVFKLVTEIEHSLMSIRTKEALNHKKSAGGPLGRPKGSAAKQSFLDANKEEVISMLERGDTVFEICKRFNVSRNTYYMFSQVEIAVSSMSDQAIPYPYCQSNSGIILKFIPHIPARNVSGMKIVDTIVRRFMIAFMRRSLLDM